MFENVKIKAVKTQNPTYVRYPFLVFQTMVVHKTKIFMDSKRSKTTYKKATVLWSIWMTM